MQFQHGGWVMNANGSLSLTPIAVDGRQLLSKPCDYDKGIYTRYNQSELFKVRSRKYRSGIWEGPNRNRSNTKSSRIPTITFPA